MSHRCEDHLCHTDVHNGENRAVPGPIARVVRGVRVNVVDHGWVRGVRVNVDNPSSLGHSRLIRHVSHIVDNPAHEHHPFHCWSVGPHPGLYPPNPACFSSF